MKLRIIILSFFLAISTISVAQVRFEAKASKNKLGVNERLRVDFEMNKDGDNFNPPSFKGFTLLVVLIRRLVIVGSMENAPTPKLTVIF